MSEEEKEAIERSKKWTEFYRLREKTNYDFLFSIKEKDIPINEIETILNLTDKLQKELKDSINARFELQRRIDKIEQENKALNKACLVYDDQDRGLIKKILWLEQKNKDLEVTCNCQLQEVDTLNFVLKERRKKIKNKIKELEALRQGTATLSNEYLQLLGGIKYLEELLEEGIDNE